MKRGKKEEKRKAATLEKHKKKYRGKLNEKGKQENRKRKKIEAKGQIEREMEERKKQELLNKIEWKSLIVQITERKSSEWVNKKKA